jgi:hypothetical protein
MSNSHETERTVNTLQPGENPLFGDYVALMDAPQRELVRAAFQERAAAHNEQLARLYTELASAVMTLTGGEDVDIRELCRGLSSSAIAEEKLYWGARVVEPREQCPVSRLFCHLVLRFVASEVRTANAERRRHLAN